MRFIRQCTRYDNGKCRLSGYPCDIKHERGEKHAITSMREIACYWFTRDYKEGQRVIGKIV